MSNHSGSYLLNDVLKKLEKESFFQFLGKEKTYEFVHYILDASFEHDCNPGEILQDIGERIGICSYCANPADEFVDGICKKCYEKDFC
jgi:hypothetical protein